MSGGVGTVPRVDALAAWTASGVAGLAGRADGPALAPPAGTIAAITELAAGAGVPDPLALLGERAALAGLGRQGAVSCGGAARLVPTADGWLAVNLARPGDAELVAAWLGREPVGDRWDAIEAAVGARDVADWVARAAPLGLPVSAVGEMAPGAEAVVRRRLAERAPLDRPPLVVDLSALWAGPLCSHLLGRHGARVVKVESTRRPDGGRADASGFFDRLNHGKASVALDLPDPALPALLAAADVVIEGSRPRALRQWGIEPDALLAGPDGPQVWVALTGHGPVDRVGFGDDAACAGGLVVNDDAGACFLADAVADPLAGIAAATAVREALAAGGTWHLDVALARVAASVVRPGPAQR